jgi:hypothetical protein
MDQVKESKSANRMHVTQRKKYQMHVIALLFGILVLRQQIFV